MLRQEGLRKCLLADLVITDHVTDLFNAQTLSGNENLLIDLIYMMATEKPLITAGSWALALGDPAKVPPQAIIRHLQPLAECNYSETLKDRHWAAAAALAKCSRLPNSKWRPKMTAAGVKTLADLAQRLIQVRRVAHSAGPRMWDSAGPTTV